MKDYKKALGVITVFVAMLTLGGFGNKRKAAEFTDNGNSSYGLNR